MMKKIIEMMTILIIIIGISFVLSSCGRDEVDEPETVVSVVGNWKTQIADGDSWHTLKMKLSNDGKYTILNNMGEFEKGTYVVEDDVVILTKESGSNEVFKILELTSCGWFQILELTDSRLKVRWHLLDSFDSVSNLVTMDIEWFRDVNQE